jgi:hypothetical protein
MALFAATPSGEADWTGRVVCVWPFVHNAQAISCMNSADSGFGFIGCKSCVDASLGSAFQQIENSMRPLRLAQLTVVFHSFCVV